MGCCAGLGAIVHDCAGRAARGGLMEFGRTKPFWTLFAARIVRLRVWRHVGCSQSQESTGRGGKGHPIRASCSGIGLFFCDVPCDRRSGVAGRHVTGAWRGAHDGQTARRIPVLEPWQAKGRPLSAPWDDHRMPDPQVGRGVVKLTRFRPSPSPSRLIRS